MDSNWDIVFKCEYENLNLCLAAAAPISDTEVMFYGGRILGSQQLFRYWNLNEPEKLRGTYNKKDILYCQS